MPYILGIFFRLCLLKPPRRTSYNVLSVVLCLLKDEGGHLGLNPPVPTARTLLDLDGGRLGPGLPGPGAVITTRRSLSGTEKESES